jgi:hypothetical protein
MKKLTKVDRRAEEKSGKAVDDRQLLEAIVLSVMQYRAACRRFNARVRSRGFDRVGSKLLDQIALRRSLLNLLAVEARGGTVATL